MEGLIIFAVIIGLLFLLVILGSLPKDNGRITPYNLRGLAFGTAMSDWNDWQRKSKHTCFLCKKPTQNSITESISTDYIGELGCTSPYHNWGYHEKCAIEADQNGVPINWDTDTYLHRIAYLKKAGIIPSNNKKEEETMTSLIPNLTNLQGINNTKESIPHSEENRASDLMNLKKRGRGLIMPNTNARAKFKSDTTPIKVTTDKEGNDWIEYKEFLLD